MSMKKIITVYEVTYNDITVRFPTKAQASKVMDVLARFSCDSEMQTQKVEVEI